VLSANFVHDVTTAINLNDSHPSVAVYMGCSYHYRWPLLFWSVSHILPLGFWLLSSVYGIS